MSIDVAVLLIFVWSFTMGFLAGHWWSREGLPYE